MKDFKKIFLDTSPIIYFLDNDKNFGIKKTPLFADLGLFCLVVNAFIFSEV